MKLIMHIAAFRHFVMPFSFLIIKKCQETVSIIISFVTTDLSEIKLERNSRKKI